MTKHFSKLKVLVFLYCFALAAALGYRPPRMEQVTLLPLSAECESTDNNMYLNKEFMPVICIGEQVEPHIVALTDNKGNAWNGVYTASYISQQIYPTVDVTLQDHHIVINGNWIDIGFCHRDCVVYGSNDKGDQWSLTTKKKVSKPRSH